MLANDPRVKKTAAHCAAVKFGVSPAVLQETLNASRSQVHRIARECFSQGLLVGFKMPSGEWHLMTPADRAEFLARPDVAALEKRRAQGRKEYHKASAAGKVPSRRIDDVPDWPIERRYARAGDDPPPVTMAVNSVFALGAA